METIFYQGKHYQLLETPTYACDERYGPYFRARARCLEEDAVYELQWEPTGGCEDGDDSLACDWRTPVEALRL